MGILTWILFGLIAGAIAKAIHTGPDPGGWLATIIIGILGSFVGGAIGTYILNWGAVDSFWSPRSWILSIGGAVLLLFIYRLVTKK